MSNPRNDYFNYVIDVLGIKSVYADTRNTLDAAAKVDLFCKVENQNNYTPAESELLEKMLTALKLDLSQIKVVSCAGKNFQSDIKVNAKLTLIFTDRPELVNTNDISETQTEKPVVTYSPRRLLQEPQFKKQAWDDLQKIIHFFASVGGKV